MKLKILLFVFIIMPSYIFSAVSLPLIQAEDASGNTLTIPDKQTNYCLYIYTFSRPKDGVVDSFVDAYLSLFGKDSCHYQIAVFGQIPFFEGVIKNAIKNGTKPEKRKNVILYFGEKQSVTSALNVVDSSEIKWFITYDGNVVSSGSVSNESMADETFIKEMKSSYKKINEVKNGKR